ncbi:MAG: phosphoribosyltransferase [Flavobacteriales bacterium]|nr:phosphoribosyltransferase [Flavobacteriales bacterium]
MENNLILTNDEIKHKIKRIAYQIYEANASEEVIYLAGITGNGFTMTNKIAEQLKEISNLEIKTIEVFINKKDVLVPVSTSIPLEDLEGKSLVLVDDVLNSGKVLIYGAVYFLKVTLKKFLTAVLVNRNHKRYPIKADFKGISLSTTRQERVEVVFEEGNDRAYLV